MNAPSIRSLVLSWAALMALLALTWGLAQLPMGALNTVASLAIATAKVAIVALFFMQLRRASTIVLVAALVGLAWLALLYGLSAADFGTRTISPAPWRGP